MQIHDFPSRQVRQKRDRAESFHLRMPASILLQVTKLAEREHRTVANMLRLLLLESLEARKENKTI